MGTVLGDAGYCPSVGYSGSPDALAYRDATFGQQDLDYPDRYGERQRPVAAGLVKSLSHPEGNVTGVSQQNAELGPKRIELLREVLPGLARVGQRRDINVPTSKLAEAEGRQSAQKLGIAYVPHHVMN